MYVLTVTYVSWPHFVHMQVDRAPAQVPPLSVEVPQNRSLHRLNVHRSKLTLTLAAESMLLLIRKMMRESLLNLSCMRKPRLSFSGTDDAISAANHSI